MGLSLSSAPNTQQQIDSLQRELYQANRENADLREELRIERGKTKQMEHGVQGVRDLLSPLYKALRLTFGEIDSMGIFTLKMEHGEQGLPLTAM